MERSTFYEHTYFPAKLIQEVIDVAIQISGDHDATDVRCNTLRVESNDGIWDHDTLDEFYADYELARNTSRLDVFFRDGKSLDAKLRIYMDSTGNRGTSVSVTAPSRHEIIQVFAPFDQNCDQYRKEPEEIREIPTIFIGHGHGDAWREIKDHLSDKHDLPIIAYETGARAGHHIRDVLEEMVTESNFALLVLTGDDITDDGNRRARQNAVHEAGLFQGKLGFHRAIVLVEEGIEVFSNIDGVQQIRFEAGNIAATYGEVLATLKREFG